MLRKAITMFDAYPDLKKGIPLSLDQYIAINPKVMNFVKTAMEIGLTDSEWEIFEKALTRLKEDKNA